LIDAEFNKDEMRKILAVDDDKDILEILQLILEDSGYEVETLSDGNYLFERIDANTPDLILLDIMLGNLDGRELCKAVKTNNETQAIPVILISASHNVSDTLNSKGAPNAFIAKPFDINVLLNTVKGQLAA
jgi:DNA-binding response OmpR family regulator